MLHLMVHGRSGAMTRIGTGLDDGRAARHIALAPAVRPLNIGWGPPRQVQRSA